MAPGAAGSARTAEADALLADGSESGAAFRTTVGSPVARVACASAALAAALAFGVTLFSLRHIGAVPPSWSSALSAKEERHCNSILGKDVMGQVIETHPGISFPTCQRLCFTSGRCGCYAWDQGRGRTCWLKGGACTQFYKWDESNDMVSGKCTGPVPAAAPPVPSPTQAPAEAPVSTTSSGPRVASTAGPDCIVPLTSANFDATSAGNGISFGETYLGEAGTMRINLGDSFAKYSGGLGGQDRWYEVTYAQTSGHVHTIFNAGVAASQSYTSHPELKNSGGEGGYYILVMPSGTMYVSTGLDSSYNTSNYVDGQWNTIAFEFTSTQVKGYVNGRLIGTITSSSSYANPDAWLCMQGHGYIYVKEFRAGSGSYADAATCITADELRDAPIPQGR